MKFWSVNEEFGQFGDNSTWDELTYCTYEAWSMNSLYICYMTSFFHLISWLNFRLLIDRFFAHMILRIFLHNVGILRFQKTSEPSWPTFLNSNLHHTSSSAFWSAIKTNILHWWPWVLFLYDFWSSGLRHIAPWSEFFTVRLLRSSLTITSLVFLRLGFLTNLRSYQPW